MSAKPLPATQKVEKIKERKRRLPLTWDGANTERGKTKREEMGGIETAVKPDRGMEGCRTGKTRSSLFMFSDFLSQPICEQNPPSLHIYTSQVA